MIVAAGVLGYEMVYSDAAFLIKKLIFVDREYPVTQLAGSLKAYKKILGLRLTSLLLPFILVLILLAQIHRLVFKLLQCPYCTAFWVGAILSTFILFQSIPAAIVGGLVSMFTAGLYNLIRMKSI
jgi:hypothetical protein